MFLHGKRMKWDDLSWIVPNVSPSNLSEETKCSGFLPQSKDEQVVCGLAMLDCPLVPKMCRVVGLAGWMHGATGTGYECDSLSEGGYRLDGQNGLLQHCRDSMTLTPFDAISTIVNTEFVEFTAEFVEDCFTAR